MTTVSPLRLFQIHSWVNCTAAEKSKVVHNRRRISRQWKSTIDVSIVKRYKGVSLAQERSFSRQTRNKWVVRFLDVAGLFTPSSLGTSVSVNGGMCPWRKRKHRGAAASPPSRWSRPQAWMLSKEEKKNRSNENENSCVKDITELYCTRAALRLRGILEDPFVVALA